GGATPAATSAIRSPSMRTEPANASRPVPSRILTLVISTVSTVSPFPARLWNDRLLAIQELLDAAGDALDVEAVLGVEALGIAGLAEADHAEPLDRRRQHLAQRLGHGAAEPAGDRVVLDGDDVAGPRGRAHQDLLVQRLDRGGVDDLGRHAFGLQSLRRLERVEHGAAAGRGDP